MRALLLESPIKSSRKHSFQLLLLLLLLCRFLFVSQLPVPRSTQRRWILSLASCTRERSVCGSCDGAATNPCASKHQVSSAKAWASSSWSHYNDKHNVFVDEIIHTPHYHAPLRTLNPCLRGWIMNQHRLEFEQGPIFFPKQNLSFFFFWTKQFGNFRKFWFL